MLTIRLTRTGKKNSPSYRVVVADKKRAVKRKFIEIIGNYNPTLKPKEIVINKERALFWVGNGAQASDTVNNLMVDLGILAKDKKIKKVYGKKMSKKAIKEGPAAPKMDHSTTQISNTDSTQIAQEQSESKETAEIVSIEENVTEDTIADKKAKKAEDNDEEKE